MIRSVLFAAALAAFAAPALAADISVPLNQARRVHLAGAAADVVVGNPEVADVTVVDARNIFITGKALGVTNVVILDGVGRTIFEGAVVVGSPGAAQVSLYRGGNLQNLACSPRCEAAQPLPTPHQGPAMPNLTPLIEAAQAVAPAAGGGAGAVAAAAASPR